MRNPDFIVRPKMNIPMLALVLLSIFALTSCEPPVVFSEAQPKGIKSLSKIPDNYHGNYWCSADSASLFIDEENFIKRKEFLVKLTRSEIDSSNDIRLLKNRLYVDDWGSSFPIEEKGDTIVSKLVLLDTIFVIRKEQILKPYKGHLILNTELHKNAWAVMVASLQDGNLLSLARAEIPENLAQLEAITPVKTFAEQDKEETQIYITPTAEQFGRILDRGLLFETSCSEFERIIPIEDYLY